MEVSYIRQILGDHRGNLRAAAQSMGVARSTLYNKMKKYGIKAEDYR